MPKAAHPVRDRLVDELSGVIAEAQRLLERASGETGERAGELRHQAESMLVNARLRLQLLQAHAREAARDADDYVHDHPWRIVGAVAGMALLAGLLIGRR